MTHLKTILNALGESKCSHLSELVFPLHLLASTDYINMEVFKKSVQVVTILVPHLKRDYQMEIAK